MSDEYRRVLHEWARERVAPYARGDVNIVSVEITSFDAGGMISENTSESATYEMRIEWTDSLGRPSFVGHTAFPEDMTKLLNELFAIASRGDWQ